jgi:PAS domain S-box-containing protein
MKDERELQDVTDENRALRERIAELERQLSRIRIGDSTDPLSSSKVSAAERAVAGFFEQPLVMLFIADLIEGRFLRVNSKVCEVLGYSEKEILETSFLDRVHPDDHMRTIKEMERLVAGERSSHFRNRHLNSDGEYRTFEWTSVVDENREICYAMAIDVTDSPIGS